MEAVVSWILVRFCRSYEALANGEDSQLPHLQSYLIVANRCEVKQAVLELAKAMCASLGTPIAAVLVRGLSASEVPR